MADVLLGLGLDMSDVARSLARLPEMTSDEAEKAIRELTKTFGKAEKEAKKLSKSITKSNKKASESFKEMGANAGDAESSIRAISGVIGLISPEAEIAANAVAEMSGAFEGVTRGSGVLSKLGVGLSIIGPIALAAAAAAVVLGTAWKIQSDKAERAAASIALLVEETEAMTVASEAFDKVAADVNRELLRAVGVYDEVGAAEEGRVKTIRESAKAERDLIMVQLARVNGEVALNEQAGIRGRQELDLLQRQKEIRAQLAEVNDQELLAVENAKTITEFKREEAKSVDFLADRQRKQADDAAADSKRALADADDLRIAAEAAAMEAQRLGDIQSAAGLVDRLTFARLSQIDQINRAEDDARSTLLENEQSTQEQLWAITGEFAERRSDLREKEAEDGARIAAMAAQSALDVQNAYLGATASLVAGASSAFTTIVENAAGENREAALVAFRVSQAAAVAQVAINTALSVSSVMATWAAFPPVAAALAATAVGVGVLQGAAILSERPKLHTGRAPDEMSATILAQESVLTGAATAAIGGPRAVEELNQGNMPRGGATSTTVEIGHRAISAMSRVGARQDRNPLRKRARVTRRRR